MSRYKMDIYLQKKLIYQDKTKVIRTNKCKKIEKENCIVILFLLLS